jgi:hypothetical protein
MYAAVFLILFLFALAATVFMAVRLTEERRQRQAAESVRGDALRRAEEVVKQNEAIRERNAKLEPYSVVRDAHKAAVRLKEQGRAALASAQQQALAILRSAESESLRRIEAADRRAEEIAGKAYDVLKNVDFYERTLTAIRNRIDGYGDAYLISAHDLLDDLAEEFGHKDAGKNLKDARARTRSMIKRGMAAECDYAESRRRIAAEHFVIDAFNGRADSALAKVRHNNFGKLRQEITDAFHAVNYGGRAFRAARITPAFLEARLEELKWATVAHELKLQEREEQRRIRERIREEAKARREYERAIRDAANEERLLRQAIANAEAQVAAATAAERARFQQQLSELSTNLREAVERNLRAVSMAEHTRRGHVYIISNIGSLGESVYKIGLTRRLEPHDRVRELGDSSVPFEFDVHAMIFSDDAPALEHRLHKHFVRTQVNKVNHRKEFFRAALSEIRDEIDSLGFDVHWTMTAEATQYRETLAIERRIAEDPAALEAWMNRQLVLEELDDVFDEDVHDEPIPEDELVA